jgi:hypothetical protein
MSNVITYIDKTTSAKHPTNFFAIHTQPNTPKSNCNRVCERIGDAFFIMYTLFLKQILTETFETIQKRKQNPYHITSSDSTQSLKFFNSFQKNG